MLLYNGLAMRGGEPLVEDVGMVMQQPARRSHERIVEVRR
jgi:hypothetical protein